MTLICTLCKANALSRCSKCQQVVYCSRSCQTTHWPVHKKICGKMMDSPAVEDAPKVNIDSPQIPLVPLEGEGYAQWLRDNDVKVPALIVPLCGLRNLGNTCYLNAAIQALSCTPMLQSVLQTVQHLEAHKCPESCFLCAFEEVSRGLLQSRNPLSPAYLLSQTKSKMFGKSPTNQAAFGGQADAPECLGFLLELIQDSIVDKGARGPAEIVEAERTSMIGHLFSFDIEQKVSCDSCGAESIRDSSELFLRLEITTGLAMHELDALCEPTDWFRRQTPALTSTNLNELIQHYHRPEPLNDYKCGGCAERGSCQKQTCISRLPNVLLILLDQNKNTGMFGKVNRTIVHVDMDGSTHSGHYVCFIYEGGGRWSMCDDARVVGVSSHYVASQQPLFVLYQLLPPEKKPPSPRHEESSYTCESTLGDDEKFVTPPSSKADEDEAHSVLFDAHSGEHSLAGAVVSPRHAPSELDFGDEQTPPSSEYECGDRHLVVGKPTPGDRTPETHDYEHSTTETESDASAPSLTPTQFLKRRRKKRSLSKQIWVPKKSSNASDASATSLMPTQFYKQRRKKRCLSKQIWVPKKTECA
eukprot:GEMP01040746.1.p1 GENE.GEMP01040746.1~~GEMP01040746.1.p1  ORF type:complete len:597 (+),score=94.58 GEMP01040746.1:38-1792(+)